jgi:hypothetical protein
VEFVQQLLKGLGAPERSRPSPRGGKECLGKWFSAAGETRRFFRTDPRFDVSMNGSEMVPSVSGSRNRVRGGLLCSRKRRNHSPSKCALRGRDFPLWGTKISSGGPKRAPRRKESAPGVEHEHRSSKALFHEAKNASTEENSGTGKRTAAPRNGERLHEQNFISRLPKRPRRKGEV